MSFQILFLRAISTEFVFFVSPRSFSHFFATIFLFYKKIYFNRLLKFLEGFQMGETVDSKINVHRISTPWHQTLRTLNKKNISKILQRFKLFKHMYLTSCCKRKYFSHIWSLQQKFLLPKMVNINIYIYNYIYIFIFRLSGVFFVSKKV